jgi:hypothetical protein
MIADLLGGVADLETEMFTASCAKRSVGSGRRRPT